MKTFTPSIYTNDNLVGFDLELLAIQRKLSCLTWIESIFGVARPQYYLKNDNMTANSLNPEEGLRGRDKWTVYYPQGRKLGEDINLTFDDSYASRLFFLTKDPINISPKTDGSDWTSYNVEISQHFSLIFHANLNKLETTSYEYLKTGLLYELNKCPKLVLKPEMYEDQDNVWKEFTITQQINGMTRFPYYCLRIEANLTYMAFPFNNNGQYDPSVDENLNNLNIVPNINPGYANTN